MGYKAFEIFKDVEDEYEYDEKKAEGKKHEDK